MKKALDYLAGSIVVLVGIFIMCFIIYACTQDLISLYVVIFGTLFTWAICRFSQPKKGGSCACKSKKPFDCC